MKRVALLGTGLIGGSLGLALRRAHPDREVIGYDTDPEAAQAALAHGAVSALAPDAVVATKEADLVVIATPTDLIPDLLDRIAGTLPAGAVVTDVGSAKAEVVARGEASVGSRFVGGHPMAGSERHGIAAASATLFEDEPWILTPTGRTDPDAYSEVRSMVASVGSRPVALEAELHDGLLARISHLPQIVATAVVSTATLQGKDDLLRIAGGGFRDVTRLAASNPDMWTAIIKYNRKAILETMGDLELVLGQAREMMTGDRWTELRDWLGAAREVRLDLFSKPGITRQSVSLSLVIPDRPGVLAEVTAVAGELGVNIEDLRIDHAAEGGRGRLDLMVAGEAAARSLVNTLAEHGYETEIVPAADQLGDL
jgi:prephenate dehydrogenase